jgi:hypothetical protein
MKTQCVWNFMAYILNLAPQMWTRACCKIMPLSQLTGNPPGGVPDINPNDGSKIEVAVLQSRRFRLR